MGIPCCLSRTSGTYTPAAVVPNPFTFNSQFVGVLSGRLFNTLPPVSHTVLDRQIRSFLFYRSLSFILHRIHNTTALLALRLQIPLDISSSCTDELIHMHLNSSCWDGFLSATHNVRKCSSTCIHDFSSASPVDLPVAVANAHRYYRRCGSGISIFYFSICTLCCVNVTSYVCHVSYTECYLRPTVLFDFLILLLLGILGSARRLPPVAMVTTDR